ncbi:MAG: hypothetical protein ABI175_09580 [Polyangiales bacterium]
MTRFWVTIPGEPKAIEMTLDDLAERQRAGKLPAGTLAAKFGENDWKPVETIPEVQASKPGVREAATGEPRSSIEPAPPSSSAQGVDMFDLPPSLGPTLLGAPDAASKDAAAGVPPPPPPPPPPRRRRGLTKGLVAVLGLVLAVIVGSGSLLCVWYRFGYTHGAVFEHLPADCAVMEYVDFTAIDESPAVSSITTKRDKALVDWAEDLDDEDGIRRSTDEDAKGRASTLRTLKRFGLRPYGDVKEVAYCEVHDEGTVEKMLAIGGSFRGKDLLTAVREGLLHRDRKRKEDKLKLDEIDGRPYLRLDDERYATMATSQVLLVGPKKLIERYIAARPVAAKYGIKNGLALVRHWNLDGEKTTTDETFAITKEKLVFTRVALPGNPPAEVTAIKERLQALAEKLRKVDGLEDLADAYENADVENQGGEVRTTVTFAMTDVAKATKALVDSDWHELKPMIEVLRPALASEWFHHAVLPGVDYLELRVSPW